MKLVITLACVLFLGAVLVTAMPAEYNDFNSDPMNARYNDINTDEIPTDMPYMMGIDSDQVATTQSLGRCLAACRGGTSAIQVGLP